MKSWNGPKIINLQYYKFCVEHLCLCDESESFGKLLQIKGSILKWSLFKQINVSNVANPGVFLL